MSQADKELQDMALEVLQVYFQNWGQTPRKRLEALEKCLRFVGVDARYVPLEGLDGAVTLDGPGRGPAEAFCKELHYCFPLGKFEDEWDALMEVIGRWKTKYATTAMS